MTMEYIGLVGLSLWVFVMGIVALIRSRGYEIREDIYRPWEKEEKRAAKKAKREKERARREFWGAWK